MTEIFYTVYPFIKDIVLVPIVWFFYVVERVAGVLSSVSHGRNENVSVIMVTYTFFFSLGVFFLLEMLTKIIEKKTKKNVLTKKQTTMISIAAGVPVYILQAQLSDNYGYVLIETIINSKVFMFILALFAILGVGSCFYYAIQLLIKIFKKMSARFKNKNVDKLLQALTLIFAVYPFMLVCVFFIELFYDPIGNNRAGEFFIINAALKNTCFIDQSRSQCPKNLEEISYIEPGEYREMISAGQVSYIYYPEMNVYTLVVRYNPVKAVVFDWRLVETEGVDFKEYKVDIIGQDRIINPPPFDGPWTFEEWGS